MKQKAAQLEAMALPIAGLPSEALNNIARALAKVSSEPVDLEQGYGLSAFNNHPAKD